MQRIARLHRTLLLGALLTAFSGCAVLDTTQREIIFQPGDRHWEFARMEGIQERWIRFECPQEQAPVDMHALWLDGPTPDAPVVLYLHGARWNNTGGTARMQRLRNMGFAVLAPDYRGFGKTWPSSLPSEDSARADALAAWDWLRTQYPDRPRLIFGHSLGGAIAIDLATRVDDEAGVMVENTLSSTREAMRNFRWGWLPLGPLITQKFKSDEKVAHIGSPLLVVHGKQDDILPPSLGQRLYQAASEPKQWVLIEGGNHHNTTALADQHYRTAAAQLFGLGTRHLQRATQPPKTAVARR